MDFIDLKSQYSLIEEAVQRRIQEVLARGSYIMGPEVAELEQRLAHFVGVEHCVSCANGTDALQLALMALGVGPGDEVVTSSFSFFATAEVICLLGAKPVFVDIDPVTFNIDAALLEAAISEKTRAIMPVSLFGQCADLFAINDIAARYRLPVIEDAAQSFGASRPDGRSCGLTTIGCTSFFPAKPLGCYGDGGACFTDDEALASRLRSLRIHGQGVDKYDNVGIGMNSRLDTIQAGILLEKFQIYPEEIIARQNVAAHYSKVLPEAIGRPVVAAGCLSVWAQYCVLIDAREAIMKRLEQAGIPSAIYYRKPLHLQSALASLGHRVGDFPAAEQVAQRILSLPMHPYLLNSECERIAEFMGEGLQP